MLLLVGTGPGRETLTLMGAPPPPDPPPLDELPVPVPPGMGEMPTVDETPEAPTMADSRETSSRDETSAVVNRSFSFSRYSTLACN